MEDSFSPSFFRQLQQLKIRTRRSYLGSRQGGHQSLRRGHGLEFADFRPYTVGDDYRHIDWGVYGRTERLFIRQFREEQDLHVSVIVDTSASMGFPKGEFNKLTLAKELATSLGYIALTDGDTVTVSLLGQKNTPRFVGPRALSRIRKTINEVQCCESFSFRDEIRAAVSQLRIPGKCFVISDFLFEIEEIVSSLNVLRAKNFEIVVLQILSPEELNFETTTDELVVDAETGETVELSLGRAAKQEYARLLSSHVKFLEEFCFKNGITHVLIPSNQSVRDVIFSRLPSLGVLK